MFTLDNPTMKIDKFINHFAIVKLHGKYGYLKEDGSYLIEPVFDEASEFTGGIALVRQGDMYGELDSKGEVYWYSQEDIEYLKYII